ncbi:Ti-type conjugative transfer relaxase TraA [Methylorubrum extorquens]|uniref:Conjugal transfer protein traA n=1 Tax=Methylorubrum extorquens (strain ATCC 14718 / DSM 1338 / JCM 2805 / NCIMB 9133 / AM1) TaxID=272630 RepID=C5B6Q9_METEA|nr:Ti-type conjugative transfer relaxase TraA [Methylorubrum extorquens]ACS44141.1 Conjugal transfer protein traA [Methylorubrum extorquens AM1]MCP1546721.1 Ti-type conjugative transfer relaxase TraA [Methylorubrum extorquens]
MAIYHLSMKPISRASGRSAVASAAYRAGERLENERDGLTHDYTRRAGIAHAEIVLPQGSRADWARDRSALWNAAERAEKRADARVAREFEIALPHELSAEQRLEATRSFAQSLADRYGTAVDFAIHAPHGDTDVRNHHAHLMMTVRRVGVDGLGEKTAIERENKWLLSHDQPTAPMQLRDIRQSWEGIANERMAAAGLDLRIDHRSHQERGLELQPTEHMGIHATQMERRGLDVSRVRIDAEAARRNADLIRSTPEQVLTLITAEKSVFDRHDVARALHRYIDQPEAFQSAFATVMSSVALVELQGEQVSRDGVVALARYSTREMVETERAMAEGAVRMSGTRSHGVDRQHVDAALATHDAAIRAGAAAHVEGQVARGALSEAEAARAIEGARLSDEQRHAVEHVTGEGRIAAVVGLAGAGKSTMLAAAREAWEAQGYTVHGAALSGKAAEGLEESSGIRSRTLASYEYGWQAGRGPLGPRDVLVVDEAGMVGSRQLARFVGEAERAGAKLILVGDHEQLQAIGAGAPFRAVAERVGFAELSEVRRQRADWQRRASQDFARHRTAAGLAAYAERGAVAFSDTRDGAREAIVRDYLADSAQRPEGSRVAMAHRRVDVRALNAAIREARQDRGELGRGKDAGERLYQTNDGARAFAAGDRIVFLENSRELGVKNGMLATVAAVEDGRITARLDGKGRDGQDRVVAVPTADYAAIDHGYATTIHKTQGATVDRAFVMASGTMDRHLAYVAMTRHRDEARLYAGRDEFGNLEALTARLSRDGAKETTLDYAAGYAERRGIAERIGIRSEIALPRDRREGPAREGEGARPAEPEAARALSAEGPVAQAPAKKRGMFAGLKLDAGRDRSGQAEARDAFAGLKLPVQGRGEGQEGQGRPSPSAPEAERGSLLKAAEDYAKAFMDAARMREAGLPVLAHQAAAIEKAGTALDAAQPDATRALRSALRYDPETRRVMTEARGSERAECLVAGIARERQAVRDPNVRAERLVARWSGLEAEHAKLSGWQHAEAREQVEERMRRLAVAIGRDAQVESVLRQRTKTLGIGEGSALGRALRQEDASISEALTHSLDRGPRERGQGLSR